MARPRVQIDRKQFEKLCAMACTRDEIARFFGCDPKTLEAWCKREFHATFQEIATIEKHRRSYKNIEDHTKT